MWALAPPCDGHPGSPPPPGVLPRGRGLLFGACLVSYGRSPLLPSQDPILLLPAPRPLFSRLVTAARTWTAPARRFAPPCVLSVTLPPDSPPHAHRDLFKGFYQTFYPFPSPSYPFLLCFPPLCLSKPELSLTNFRPFDIPPLAPFSSVTPPLASFPRPEISPAAFLSFCAVPLFPPSPVYIVGEGMATAAPAAIEGRTKF